MKIPDKELESRAWDSNPNVIMITRKILFAEALQIGGSSVLSSEEHMLATAIDPKEETLGQEGP
jgi:hypothetical protein